MDSTVSIAGTRRYWAAAANQLEWVGERKGNEAHLINLGKSDLPRRDR